MSTLHTPPAPPAPPAPHQAPLAAGWTPELTPDDHFMHLVGPLLTRMDGEIKRFVFSKTTGRSKYEWAKRSTRWPNHLLDCEVMQLAFACFLGAFNPIEPKEEK